jgi:hypothetical protein
VLPQRRDAQLLQLRKTSRSAPRPQIRARRCQEPQRRPHSQTSLSERSGRGLACTNQRLPARLAVLIQLLTTPARQAPACAGPDNASLLASLDAGGILLRLAATTLPCLRCAGSSGMPQRDAAMQQTVRTTTRLWFALQQYWSWRVSFDRRQDGAKARAVGIHVAGRCSFAATVSGRLRALWTHFSLGATGDVMIFH